MTIINGVMGIKYSLMDHKKAVMVDRVAEKRRKRMGKSKGESAEGLW